MGDSANLHASHSSSLSVHQHMTGTKIGEVIRSGLHAVNSEGSDWEGVNQIDEEGVKLYDSGGIPVLCNFRAALLCSAVPRISSLSS